MGRTSPKSIDRHWILAEIKRRYGSLTELARYAGSDVRHLTVAMARPYPKAEQIIAAAIDVPVSVLWPDRYHPDGQRRRGKKAISAGSSQSGNSTRRKGG